MRVSNLQIASSYANAWFKQAQETCVLEEACQDVILLKRVGQENSNLIKVLQSPIIPSDKKWTIFQELFVSRTHSLTLTVFYIMSKNRREACLLPVLSKFLELYRVYHRVQLASITTSCKLPADLASYVKDLIKDWKPCQEVILKERVNPTILGGFILKVGDQQLDHSLANKLARMRKEFSIIPD